MGTENAKGVISQIRRNKTAKLILPSQIQNLKDLECFLKLPNYDITKIKLQYKHYPERTEPFICRPDLVLDNIIMQQNEVFGKAQEITGDGSAETGKQFEKEDHNREAKDDYEKDHDI